MRSVRSQIKQGDSLKSLIAALFIVSFSTHAKSVNLRFTSSSDSVQAVLTEVLESYKTKMDSISTSEFSGIRRDGSKLIVEDGSEKVVCDARTFGMAMVMNYECRFSKSEYPWNKSSLAVAATLYNALFDVKNEKSWLSDYIGLGSNGELVLQDDHTRLECKSGSPGMLAVQQYTCSVGTH